MSDKPYNPYAFPVSNSANVNGDPGMSLRDWFAGMAIMGQAHHQGHHPKTIEDAYAIADALLKERGS